MSEVGPPQVEAQPDLSAIFGQAMAAANGLAGVPKTSRKASSASLSNAALAAVALALLLAAGLAGAIEHFGVALGLAVVGAAVVVVRILAAVVVVAASSLNRRQP